MNKKDAIIYTAADLIHQMGYHHVGIKTILDALNIPKGSFYHYFKSKEDLGLAIIDMYTQTLKDEITNYPISIEGLYDLLNSFFCKLKDLELKRGCPIGNLILELADENETFRCRLLEWYIVLEDWATIVLKENSIDNANHRAKALIAAFEGAMLLVKLEKDMSHFDIFNKYTFKSILNIG